jgi:hypothetical protein
MSELTKLNRILPESRTGSCGMMVTFALSASRLIFSVARPSIFTLPVVGTILRMARACMVSSVSHSTLRGSELTNVDLPEPVLPTIPTRSPLLIVTSRLSSTTGPSTEYRADSLSRTTSPLVGHAAGGWLREVALGSWSMTR